MNSPTRLTACVCTHNRAEFLPHALAALERLPTPEHLLFDVLVVDNASSDATYEVSRPFLERNPSRFRYVYEATLGLSYARNRGLRESSADVVAFLDDDAVPRDGWLAGLMEGYRQGENIGAVGGQAWLAFRHADLPSWFKKPLYPKLFSHREVEGDQIMECRNVSDYPFGANISFQRAAALNLGGFDVNLGRKGKKLLSGEETLLCERMREAGYRVLLHPQSIVDHYIDPNMISLIRLFEQAWADGQINFVWTGEELSLLNSTQVASRLMRSTKRYLFQLLTCTREKHEMVMLSYAFVMDISKLYHRWKLRTTLAP
jgi:glycosyltransferase involved in cell wall biosynthesis